MPQGRRQRITIFRVPYPRCFIGAGSQDPFAVGTEGRCPYPVFVFQGRGQLLAGDGVPDQRSKVLTGSDDTSTVWTERREQNSVAMFQWRARRQTGGNVPNLRIAFCVLIIRATTHQAVTIGAELGILNRRGVLERFRAWPARNRMPGLNLFSPSDGDPVAVRAKAGRTDRVVAFQGQWD